MKILPCAFCFKHNYIPSSEDMELQQKLRGPCVICEQLLLFLYIDVTILQTLVEQKYPAIAIVSDRSKQLACTWK